MGVADKPTIKGYDLIERIGEGAYGSVYRAYQPHMRREVAIKIIQPRYANQPDFIRRFDVEAQLVAQLEHLHIVPLYDYWREPDGAYLVMRQMKGGSLEKSLSEEGPWEAEQGARLVDQIASALDAAHKQGIVHRDLKPANILLDEQGNAYLSDFGIAKELERGTSITQTGAMLGTPAYISPEQVQSQPVTPQTDIYSLGVVIYELLVGGHPFLDSPTAEMVAKHLYESLPSVREKRKEIPEAVDQVIQQATAKRPADRYANALALAADFRRALQLEIEAPEVAEEDIYNPYKGLRPFQEADAGDFYGREELIEQLLARLKEKGEAPSQGRGQAYRFLAVVGPSGSGKSSVVKAGLIPALRGGALPGSEKWFITEMKPGAHPLEELELAILRVAVSQPPSLLGQIKEDSRGLLRAVRRVLPEGSELLLVVDQLEELFTLCKELEEVSYFLESISEAVSDPQSPLRVVTTLRADYYDRPLRHARFSTLMELRTQVVKPLTTNELEGAITKPANHLGVKLESSLTSTILSEVYEEPGALPILQYALTELFELREDRVITQEAYERIGGVRGALAKRAEELYGKFDNEGQESARQLFLRLVTLGEGEEDTRRRVLRSELRTLTGESLPEVIEIYGRARLLTFDHDPLTREPTVEVAHEALLHEWGRLRDWLDESRADIRMQRVLGNAAEEWQATGRDPGFLLRGSRLDQFEGWAESTNLAMTQLEGDYLEASLAERREREAIEAKRQEHEATLERRSRRFLWALVGVMAVAAVVAVILSVTAINQREMAQNSAATATIAQGQAQNEAATAVAAQEEAQLHAEAEETARLEAEKARRISTANELVAFAKNELENPSDVSYSLALLLAREAVRTTMNAGEPVTSGAEEVLRQAINVTPIQGTIFEGHTGRVNYAAWSPDGQQIATASEDGTARIWDVQNGEELQRFVGHSRAVNSVTWSPDGTKLLTASDDHNVRMWDGESGIEIRIFEGHGQVVYTARWNEDGTKIITASEDVIILWDAQTGEEIYRNVIAPSGEIGQQFTRERNYGQFSPTGEQIVTHYGVDLIVLNAQTGEEVNSRIPQPATSNWADWSLDGNHLVTANDVDTAYILDVNTGETIQVLQHDSRVEHASWNTVNNQVATVTQRGIIHIWDAQTGESLHQWQMKYSPLNSVEWSPDGKRILTAGADGLARIWEVGTPGQSQPLEHPSFVSSADWSPDGINIISTSSLVAYIWELESGQEVLEFDGHLSLVYASEWEPGGERIITGDANGIAMIWDANTGEPLQILRGHSQAIFSAAWSPDSKWVITSGQDSTARIWDAENGEQVKLLQGHNGGVLSAAWSPDGELIITTGADNKAIIWNAESGEDLIQLKGHSDRITGADWHPDGSQVATASADNTVRIWDVNSGQEVVKLSGHNGAVLSVDWEPGGGEIVTAGEDSTARIWDVITREEIGKISGHEGAIIDVSWSPDGSQILTASADRTVRIWPVGIEGLLYLADSLILRDPAEFTPGERCIYLHECGE